MALHYYQFKVMKRTIQDMVIVDVASEDNKHEEYSKETTKMYGKRLIRLSRSIVIFYHILG